MRKISLFTLFLFTVTFTNWSCNKEAQLRTVDRERGTMISHELLFSYSPSQVDSLKTALGVPALTVLTSSYGIDAYKIIYNTIDQYGQAQTTASGLCMIPTGISGRVPMGVYCHGTILEKSAAPSGSGVEKVIGILFSSSGGFCSVLPDYLGLGDGPGRHPYQHGKSEATATVDMMRASRELVAELGTVTLNEQVFITGYSQGGHSAAATTKEIEQFHADEFQIAASYPMSGAYDLSGVQARELESDKEYSNPFYLPFLLLTYNDIYKMYDSPSDFLKAPYDETLPPLFDGYHSGGQINSQIPNVPKLIIRDDVYAAYMADPNHVLRRALRDNDLYNFTYKAPMRICACNADEQVMFSNAIVMKSSMDARGRSDIELTNPGNFDHGGCVVPCLLDAFFWFSSLKEQ